MAYRRKGRGTSGRADRHSRRDQRNFKEGLVLSVLGKGYYVDVGGEEWFCRVRGRLFLGEGVTWPVVGDRVLVEPWREDKKGIISEIQERRTVLARQAPETRQQQVLAANLDRILICMAITDPPFRPGLVDRYLVSAEALRLEATLVCNKVDLVTDEEIRSALEEFEAIGYETICTSVPTGEGLDRLRARLAGQMSVLTGPSGAGKSSLVNALVPDLDLRTGDVNEVTGKGRHTTTASRLIDLGDGYLVDTPGIREFSLWQVSLDELPWCFVEFRPFLGGCRFRDCSHTVEPDCGVRDALQQGDISARRYESYRMLHQEVTEAEAELSPG